LAFGRNYAPVKTLLAHPFKLKVLAKLCAGSGEFMVFPTLTIVAAARGMYATFHEYPHLEHDQNVLQGRAQQLIEYHLRLWPDMTNDVSAYTRLFTPAFLFGYRLGDAMVQEVNAEERQTMVQGVRSMDNAAALIFLDLIIRDRMQEMGVKTIYELL
jgi:hypothetical protein